MLRGKKKECAYGFCDIRQFTDTVECLQDQVMLFTNSVGEIVHQVRWTPGGSFGIQLRIYSLEFMVLYSRVMTIAVNRTKTLAMPSSSYGGRGRSVIIPKSSMVH